MQGVGMFWTDSGVHCRCKNVAMLAHETEQIDIAVAIDTIHRHRHRHSIRCSQLENLILDLDLDDLAVAVLHNKKLCCTDGKLCCAGRLKVEW